MSFSYSGDPSNSDKDQVRFLIGDTDANSPLLQDAEILYTLGDQGTVLSASVAACIGIAAKFARLMDESVGDVSKSYSQRQEHYTKLADSLRRRDAENSVCPYAGGISVADKETLNQNTDYVEPSFKRKTHDNRLSTDNPSDNNPYNDDY